MRGPLSMIFLLPGFLFGQSCFDKALLHSIAAQEAHAALPKARSGPDRAYDLTYQRLDLHVDPAIRAIAGTVTHHFIASAELLSIGFDLSGSLQVSGVHYHGSPIGYQHQEDRLNIDLPVVFMEKPA